MGKGCARGGTVREVARTPSILREHLNKFIIAYFDNIIIYLISKEEHGEHVKWVLKRL